MKVMIKKIAIGAAAAAMAMSAVAVTASAAVKHPGESGCCYDANENTTNAYGKHPGESGYCYDADQNNTNAYGKHPGESGYCYYENQQAEVNCEDQPGIEDPDVLYGKHPGEAGYEYAVALLELVQGLPLELGTKAVDSFFANGYVKEDIFEEIMKYHQSEKHPGECGYNYESMQNGFANAYGKHPGESGCCYDANELGYDPSKYTEEQIRMIEASREVNGFVCGTLLMQFDEENAAKAKTEAKPQADENGKHPGESGYCYDANELGYDPSKYTEEQIRMIEASREVNGFVCGTLLMQFDEENAAKAKTEEKPQHATGLKVIGDVNCDGVIDVSDSVLLCRFLCEDEDAVMTEQGRINADVNGDGRLTMDDNTALLDRIAKKE